MNRTKQMIIEGILLLVLLGEALYLAYHSCTVYRIIGRCLLAVNTVICIVMYIRSMIIDEDRAIVEKWRREI